VPDGVFARWQPRYAEHGITTFPCNPDKTPAIRGYLKVSRELSCRLVSAFGAHDALGLACQPNGITVLDVDAPDERVLRRAFDQFGESPFIVRSGSGHYQAWYANAGERRLIRPIPDCPIDILGAGFVVAPPSRSQRGPYEIIEGSLADVHRLPQIRNVPGRATASSKTPAGGGRNDALFRRALTCAKQAATQVQLLGAVTAANLAFDEPLGSAEVSSVTASAWRYRMQGRLMISGSEASAIISSSELDRLRSRPIALVLLVTLRQVHGWRNGEPFVLSNATAERVGCSRPTLSATRRILARLGYIEILHEGGRGKGDPPIVRLIGR